MTERHLKYLLLFIFIRTAPAIFSKHWSTICWVNKVYFTSVNDTTQLPQQKVQFQFWFLCFPCFQNTSDQLSVPWWYFLNNLQTCFQLVPLACCMICQIQSVEQEPNYNSGPSRHSRPVSIFKQRNTVCFQWKFQKITWYLIPGDSDLRNVITFYLRFVVGNSDCAISQKII